MQNGLTDIHDLFIDHVFKIETKMCSAECENALDMFRGEVTEWLIDKDKEILEKYAEMKERVEQLEKKNQELTKECEMYNESCDSLTQNIEFLKATVIKQAMTLAGVKE